MTPQVQMTLFALSSGVGLMMVVSGVQKSALEWRRRRRMCPSCGRQIEQRTCRCTS